MAMPAPYAIDAEERRSLAAGLRHAIRIDRSDLAVLAETINDAEDALLLSAVDRVGERLAEAREILALWREQLP